MKGYGRIPGVLLTKGFQRSLHWTGGGQMRTRQITTIYIDDLLVFTKQLTREEHAIKVCIVLQKLRENNLFLKPSKCKFFKDKIKFLEMTVSKDGIQMLDDKVKALMDWTPPTRVKGVHGFLGLANFYRRFIP